MRRLVLVGIFLAALLTAQACEKDSAEERPKAEDLTIVVEADRSKISQDEERLRARQAAFEEERRKLRDEREQLMTDKTQMQDKDKVAARRLKEIEQRLWEKERSMWGKEAQLETEFQALTKNKDELLQKVTRAPVAAAPGAGIGAREGSIAQRERNMARREGDLAAREKDVAQREEDLSRREAEFLQIQARLASSRVPAMPRVSASPTQVTEKQAEQAFKKASAKMNQRGILWGDLPLELAGLRKEFYDAKKEGEFGRARDAVAQLDAALVTLVIDAGFIDRKFTRLNELIKRKPPKDKQAVSTLLRKATQMVGDGKHPAANRELNRIFALLKG